MAMVTLRVEDAEKALWVEAAGGSRKLSEWLRSLASAALTESNGESARQSGPVRASGSLSGGDSPGALGQASQPLLSVSAANDQVKTDFKGGKK